MFKTVEDPEYGELVRIIIELIKLILWSLRDINKHSK